MSKLFIAEDAGYSQDAHSQKGDRVGGMVHVYDSVTNLRSAHSQSHAHTATARCSHDLVSTHAKLCVGCYSRHCAGSVAVCAELVALVYAIAV